ncbi:MAG: ABC transporter ATP-binding protein [Pseudomonadota bacterium]
MNAPATPILQAANLTKRFGGLTAVDDVSFSLTPGEILGVIGPNGSGKTTLFSLISGFLAPDAGVVRLEGTEITKRQPAALARLGLVRTFQIVQPFAEASVTENVVIAGLLGGTRPLPEARAIAEEVLDFLELAPMASRLAETLTIADRKKLEVARALACKPRVLLLDEVMAGLRPSEVDEAIQRIQAIRARGISIILVEHLMRAVVALSDRLIVLRQGQVIAEGHDPLEVLARHEVVEAYFGKAAHAART